MFLSLWLPLSFSLNLPHSLSLPQSLNPITLSLSLSQSPSLSLWLPLSLMPNHHHCHSKILLAFEMQVCPNNFPVQSKSLWCFRTFIFISGHRNSILPFEKEKKLFVRKLFFLIEAFEIFCFQNGFGLLKIWANVMNKKTHSLEYDILDHERIPPDKVTLCKT